MNIKYLRYGLGVFLLYIISFCAHGQNVSFDSTFGFNARTFTQHSNATSFASDYQFTTVKADGSFFMVGSYNQPDSNLFVTKFKPDGRIDNSYANNGKLFIRRADFGVTSIVSTGMDSSFRFFFVGKTTSPNGNPFFRLKVIRFTASATIDSSFGINGMADMPFDNLTLSGINYPVAAYRDGRLLISHLLYEGIFESCGLVRLKENGKLDSSFATNGKLYLPPYSGLTTFYTLNIQPDEKILFTRQASGILRLFRYNANGTIDNSFNQTGIVNIDFPATNTSIQAIRIMSDNKILISAGSGAGYYLYRFRTNGLRDSTFGGIGYTPYNYGFKTYSRDLAEQPDGKILAAGVIQDNQQPIPNINTLITRTNVDGSIDSTFDNDGVWFFNYAGNPSSGMKHIALLSSGKVLFSGLESGPAIGIQFVTYRLKEVYKSTSVASVAWGPASALLINYNCGSQVKLQWSTLNEVNTSYFKIQYSTDNVQFTNLTQIPAAGNSTGNSNYEYLHTLPNTGTNFYKISVVTNNGQEFTYGTVSATINSFAQLFQWQLHEITKKPNDDCLPAIKLHFTTQRPVGSNSIIIEYSRDSTSFLEIGSIAVINPQNQVSSYEYLHQSPVSGKNYYRLKVTDSLGSCFSPIYKVDLKDINDIFVYPVPATDKLFFSQSLPAGSQLILFDMKGALVMNKILSSAINELTIPNLASGQYILKVFSSCKEKVFKVIIMAR